jgi:hypothetical protein
MKKHPEKELMLCLTTGIPNPSEVRRALLITNQGFICFLSGEFS